jgi:prepilin-type processing-associated H-X9-DG protein
MTPSSDESKSALGLFRWWAFAALSTVGMFTVTALLLMPAITDTDTPSNSTVCTRNLREVGTALLKYAESSQRILPPAVIVDRNGKAINSWRVLMLRALDRPDLAAIYDLTEPPDGATNRKLKMDSLNYLFWCPSAFERPTGLTNYLVVTGPGTLFPGDKQVNLNDVKDGLENTILLVEVADSDISWMEPGDLTIHEALQGINASIHGKGGKGKSISSNHPGGAYVMLADGHVRFLSEETSPVLLKALLTINGGEDLKALGRK